MKYPYQIALILFALLAQFTWAQQDPLFTFYRFNMTLINPAYAGSTESGELTVGMRSQWAAVEGSPQSQNAIFSMPVGSSVGLGISILNDQTFIENQTLIAVDFSYKLSINPDYDLYLGLKAGGNSYSANSSGLVAYGIGQDGSLTNFSSRFTPNFGIGLYLRHNNHFMALSLPKLLTPDRIKEEDGIAFSASDKRHIYLSGGYDYAISENFTIVASSMLRYVESAPLSVELTGLFDFGKRFKLGASYRVDAALSGLFLFDIQPGFSIGYAYETALQQNINAIDNSSHELFMRIAI